MPNQMVRLAVVGAFLVCAALVAIVHIAAPRVSANGRVVEFDRRIAGEYEIALGKIPPSPIVGNFYLSILLTETATEMPVLGADVVVTAVGPVPVDESGTPIDAARTSAMPASASQSSQAESTQAEAGQPEIGPIMVNPDPDSENYPGYYDTEQPIVLDRTGLWMFTVSVDSPTASAATADFPVEVTTPNPLTGIVTLVALMAFIVVVALAVRMYIRERRRSRSS
ncbi:MAG: hypothetical protein OXG80_09645 [Chloroflexi bacterium]|nr:hypothetical protein [Chloroflexota bacterium]MCY3639340.1 hypothetical protein [Chloroflexota bacterium]